MYDFNLIIRRGIVHDNNISAVSWQDFPGKTWSRQTIITNYYRINTIHKITLCIFLGFI